MRRRILYAAAAGLSLALAALPTNSLAAGGSSTLTITAGTSTISGAAPGNFSATLTGSDQTVYAALGTYTAADLSGTGNGWHVTFQATRFACTSSDTGCPTAGDTFPASSMLLGVPTVACATGTDCTGRAAAPTIKISSSTAVDSGSAVSVASAATNTGMGTYNFTPANFSGANTGLQLSVPSYAYATTYHSTLTVSFVSGP